MNRLLTLVLLVGVVGCGDAPPSAPKPPDDPNIRVKENVGGGVGPVQGGRGREYEGPASKAPQWVRDQQKGK